ncbi:hypothetical protein WMY93_030741 [Mugilogobius chulae]|uniref:5-oxoprolinase n=1 Tax=Mugilogobius chulae TaxID=88201 RepID=A0AAW0MM64_9GOBI
MAETKGKYDFAIDRGGTFTDVFARLPDGRERVLKLLSWDPQNYKDAPTEGIRRVLEEETGRPYPRDQPVDTSLIGWIRMGTTVATNALLEREGERTALLVTKGFKDLLHIGTQARPKLFDLEVAVPEVLYEEVIEVDERVVLKQDECKLPRRDAKRCVTGSTGDSLEVWKELDLEQVEKDLKGVLSRGINCLAVLFLHSYTWSDHEKAVGSLAQRLGFAQVSLSSEVMPMVRAVPRGYTVCADAYLTPKIRQYLKGFTAGFQNALKNVDVLFMQSDGGLTPMGQFCGSRAVLSGPAGGVVGYAVTSYSQMEKKPVIGFDMGGTSTDVSRYAGQYEHVFEATTAGVTLQAPQLDINTVAAGGGSRLFFRSGMFVVGPESAGAHPGPACYRKGGPLTVTDANLALGRLLPSFFPKIFGPGENEPLSLEETMKHFHQLTRDINLFLTSNQSQSSVNGFNLNNSKGASSNSEMSVEEVAMGFIRVANEAMCRPIRALTQAKGHDTSQHVLACFGGAGGQHACAIARALGMKSVFIHKYSGVLSAYGLALADVVEEVQEPCSLKYEEECYPELNRRVDCLSKRCTDTLCARGFKSGQITTEVFLHLRYEGTDCALMVTADGFPPSSQSCKAGDFRSAFTKRYLKEFGFTIAGRPIVVDDIRVRGCGKSGIKSFFKSPRSRKQLNQLQTNGQGAPKNLYLTNIKERLDFSCAVFGPDGGLVSNAPHIPVHLGAMQETVQYQIKALGSNLNEGDVILSNHPCAGGSHLPDLTVITPVFRKGLSAPVFFVASRGHHADIGGITPGSMPPHSTSLTQEGAVFISFKLSNAELAVRDMLRDFAQRRRQQTGSLEVESEDFMDDGSPIRLRVQINEDEGCLAPIKVIIPPGSILQPSQNAAVVGGNVLTSQRVVDVIFKAFEVCAASQGCMNNISFGSEKVGYYETVAGGAGAGPGWNGRSGVHSHMTIPASQTRKYWKKGGEAGAAGLNLLQRQDGRRLNLGAKTSVTLEPGDMFCLYTPGGGGYGRGEETNGKPQTKRRRLNETFPERGSVLTIGWHKRECETGPGTSRKKRKDGEAEQACVSSDKEICNETAGG